MTTAEHAYRTAGTLAEWQRHIALPAAGNSRLVFTLSCAFAAPLLQLADEESGGFHLRGPSSVGKTTAVKAAASVWGGGSVGGYVRTWRATANGLEGLAEMHCDALLCLDEMSQVNPREAGETAYMLANGAGKSRAGRNGKARQSAQWRVLVLSNGEVSLADKMNEAGQRTRAGQEARLVDVQADAGAGLGLFEDLHGVSSPEAFARSISDAAKRFYGTAARDYLTRLTANSDGLGDAVRTARKRWVSKHCPADADGQVLRVAGRFGLVAAAGELAATMGILPWGEGEAEKAAASCFEAWLEVRGGTGAAEITAGIEQVRHFIAVHGEARFSSDSDDRPTINRAGFRVRGAEGTTDFLVLPQVWRREICAGFDPRAIANALIERGVLIPDAKDGKPQSRHRLPSLGVKRVYYLTAEILGDGGNDPTEETPWDGIDHA